MRRIFIIVILLGIIVLSFGFVVLSFASRGQEDNYFNRKLRDNFAAQPFFRRILSLHFDGDAKADYLGERYEKILIEVDVMDSLSVSAATLEFLANRIAQAAGKQVSYLISDGKVPYQEFVNGDKLRELVGRYRNHKTNQDRSVLYVLYAAEFENEPDRLGSTFDEYGIVLYTKALERFTRNSPATLSNYEASTALHEFGHQIGLSHNRERGCLMNEHAEEAHVAAQNPEDVIIDFCEFEKDQIK